MKKIFGVAMSIMCACILLTGCGQQSIREGQESTRQQETQESTQQQMQAPDLLSGKTLTAGDGSSLQLKEDGSYIWYQDASVTNDNYYKGTYEMYVGEQAITVLDGMTEYGFTEQEQRDLLACNAGDGLTANDWYVMVQTRTYRMVNGEETDENTGIVYAGFYYRDEKTYDSVNCNSANYAVFTVE